MSSCWRIYDKFILFYYSCSIFIFVFHNLCPWKISPFVRFAIPFMCPFRRWHFQWNSACVSSKYIRLDNWLLIPFSFFFWCVMCTYRWIDVWMIPLEIEHTRWPNFMTSQKILHPRNMIQWCGSWADAQLSINCVILWNRVNQIKLIAFMALMQWIYCIVQHQEMRNCGDSFVQYSM